MKNAYLYILLFGLSWVFIASEPKPSLSNFPTHKKAGAVSPIWDIVGKDKKFLSDWDRFRLAAFDTVQSLNRSYHFNLTDIQAYDGIMKVFFSECKFRGSAINPMSGAQGLIQFTDATIKEVGIPENVAELSEVQQLEYVAKYFRYKMRRHRINGCEIDSFIDLYMVIFAPSYTTAPDSWTIYGCTSYKECRRKKKRRCAYHSNRGYDTNRDGKIKKQEIRDYILNKHYKDK